MIKRLYKIELIQHQTLYVTQNEMYLPPAKLMCGKSSQVMCNIGECETVSRDL